jgi:hypothetical protein
MAGGRAPLRMALGAALILGASTLAGPAPAALAANATGISTRFDDGLDARYSSYRLAQATAALGYAATGQTGGRTASETWNDGLNSAVFGLFGHGNGGIFQPGEGSTDAEDPILAAGTDTDPVSIYANFRLVSEYLPVVDVDDMRLLVLAGCYTANTGNWGNFSTIGTQRGIDVIVGFSELVYYPKTTVRTALTATNYSGNYFWDRFSAYVQGGSSITTALSRARTDLVAKEGSAGGWDHYVIRGAAADPGAVTLRPAGGGELLNGQPLGTAPYATLGALTLVSQQAGTGPTGGTTEVITSQGVLYRLAEDGSLLDLTAPAATQGSTALSDGQAYEAALTFVRANVAEFGPDWRLVSRQSVSHVAGDAVMEFVWRPVYDGRDGGRQITVELDRRTGAVTYLASVGSDRSVVAPAVDAGEAIALAEQAVGTDAGSATATQDSWDGVPRWTVTLDHGLVGRPGLETPRSDRIVLDARTGDVLAMTTT